MQKKPRVEVIIAILTVFLVIMALAITLGLPRFAKNVGMKHSLLKLEINKMMRNCSGFIKSRSSSTNSSIE
jgi:hypothetical protein